MQPRQRLDHIDGLRGIAAMAVIFQHATQFVQEAGVPYYRYLLESINMGRFGVVLFFLISGLVIPFSFRGERPLRNFVISRFFRLYPAYWLSIPLLGSLYMRYGVPLSADLVLANMTMLQGLWGGRNIGNGYWTLAYEMIFYIACAFLFWSGKLADVACNGIAVAVSLVISLAPVVIAFQYGSAPNLTVAPFFISLFFLGMLLRRVFVDRCESARKWAIALVPLTMLVGLAMSGWLVSMPENGIVYLRPVPLAAGMILPVVVFILVLWLKPVPGRVLTYLATISYSLYLFQDIGLLLLRDVLAPGEWPIGYVLAVFGLTLVIASLVYRCIEHPMIQIGRALTGPSRGLPPGSVPA